MRNKLKYNIIGFAGKKKSGKDSLAQALITQHNDVLFSHIAFAEPVKSMAHALLVKAGLSSDNATKMLYNQELKERCLPELLGLSARQIMQTLGTEWARSLSPDIWVNIGLNKAKEVNEAGRAALITDVRFPNEVAAIRNAGGIVVWVKRDATNNNDTHSSENSLTAEDCDIIIDNNGTLIDATTRLAEFLAA